MERKMEHREAFFSVDYKTREDGGDKIIEGYFIVYDQPTELWSGFTERIAFGACAKSIQRDDIRALYNHKREIVLGRNKAGTLTLSEDAHGVEGRIVVNQNDSEALNVYERVKRGDITGCSFGFRVVDEEWKYGDNGDVDVTIKEVDVYEISVCPFPAYPQTTIEARQRDYTESKKRSLEAKKEKAKERLKNVVSNIKAQ